MRLTVRLGILLGATLTLGSCDLLFGPGGNARAQPLERLPRDLSMAEREVISASNGFAFDILRETIARDESGNVLLSPLSASMALGMTMNGARGVTFDEMRDVLGFSGVEQDAINESYRSLIDLLLGLDDGVEMRLGNSVWARTGFPFHATFMDVVRGSFDAEVASLDFDAPGASQTINDWVDRSTNGRISEIVPAVLPRDAVMYLINAIYFKGEWSDRFDPGRTRDAPFHRAGGGTSTVRMMMRTGFDVYQDEEVSVAELRYGRGAFVMNVVVPRGGRSVGDVAASLDAEQWNTWISGLSESRWELGLPRFQFDYETTMNDALIALGMEAAFDDRASDFTGLSPLGDDLMITEVKQKTFIKVDEEGTEAAAATSVEVGVTSMPPSLIVDRPFIVTIRERFSGTIMFIGVVGDPQ